MKILMYTVININDSFGSGLHVKKVAEKLKSKGHDILLFSPLFEGRKENYKFPVTYVGPKGNGGIITKFLQDTTAVIKLFNLLRQHWKPDIVYSRFGLSTVFLPITCKILNINYITELNGSPKADLKYRKIPGYLTPFLLSVERLNYKCSIKIITVSDELAQIVKKIRGVNKNKVLTVLNGVEVNDFKADVQCDNELKKIIRGKAKLVFGFVGRFEKWHGLINIVEAFAILKKDRPSIAREIRVIFIGVGTEQKALEMLIEKTGTRDMFLFTGWIDHKDLPKHLKYIDIALAPYLPYSKESGSLYPCPLKILDYLAAEKWIITVDTVFSDVILKYQAGYILKEVSPRALLDSIIWAWENRKTIFKNYNITRDFVEDNYSWDITIQKIENIFNDTVNCNHP